MMAQRAFPNPFADYDKSLATGYFDSSGRVSFGADFFPLVLQKWTHFAALVYLFLLPQDVIC